MNTERQGRGRDETDQSGNKDKKDSYKYVASYDSSDGCTYDPIVFEYVSKYDRLSENLAVSSEFNLHFKDDIDLEMYYIAIGSKENSYLPEVMKMVEEAEDTLSKLQANAFNGESRKNIKHLEAYLENLANRMQQLTEIKSYGQRMTFMDNNIRILTGLIMEEMQNFIYNESMYLVHNGIHHDKSSIYTCKWDCAAFFVTIIILLRCSFRFSRKHYQACDGEIPAM